MDGSASVVFDEIFDGKCQKQNLENERWATKWRCIYSFWHYGARTVVSSIENGTVSKKWIANMFLLFVESAYE